MTKPQKAFCIFCVALFLLLPLSMLAASLIFSQNTAMPNFAHAEYFAVTDGEGQEYVYRPSDKMFQEALALFSSATPMEESAAKKQTESGLVLEWIQNGRADRFTLRYSADRRAAYLTDREGRVYCLAEGDGLLFLTSEVGQSLLVGDFPPTLTLDGREVSPAVLEWIWNFTDKNGVALSLSSGERLFSPGSDIQALPRNGFSFAFPSAPADVAYTLFDGAETVGAGQGIPVPAELPSNARQLVLVVTWQNSDCSVRVGYSFLLA